MMSSRILVTYATRTGSTVGVAEAIGKTLAENGAQVEVLPMQDVKDLAPYQAVIAGSAIQGQNWLPEAVAFVRTHRSALSQKPFAIFTVCMTMTIKDGAYSEAIRDWVQPVRALVKPMSEGYFAGTLDISKVPSFADRLKFRISVMTRVWSEGDHRDWDAIRDWANDLAGKLRLPAA